MSGLIEGQKVGVGIKIDTSDTPAEDDTLVWREASKAFVPEPLGSASVAADSITNVKLANMATSTVKARVTAGTGDPEDITVAQLRTLIGITAAGLALVDDASAGAQLTTLGVSAFVQTILNDADAAAVFTTLGISAFVQTVLNDADAAAVLATLGIVAQSAYTQTYATANKTHANPTAVDLTDNSAGTPATTIEAVPDPTDTPVTADALRDDLVAVLIPAVRNNFASLAAQHDALVVDLDDVKQLINAVIDDLQALTLVG